MPVGLSSLELTVILVVTGGIQSLPLACDLVVITPLGFDVIVNMSSTFPMSSPADAISMTQAALILVMAT